MYYAVNYLMNESWAVSLFTIVVKWKPVVLVLFWAANGYKHVEGVVSNSRVYFTHHVPSNTAGLGPEPLRLRRILDMVSFRQFGGFCCVADIRGSFHK